MRECSSGYSNPTNDVISSFPCNYPSYGARCGSLCNGSEDDCHHVFECPVRSKYYFLYFWIKGKRTHYIYIKTWAVFVNGTPTREVYFWFCLFYTIYFAKWYTCFLHRTTFLLEKNKKMWHALNLRVLLQHVYDVLSFKYVNKYICKYF